MADDEESAGQAASLPRRNFLKLGVTGATSGVWLDDVDEVSIRDVDPMEASGFEGGPTESTAKEMPAASFLPPTAEVISVDGLDSAGEFAVSSVASDHAVDRRPLSVRELVTPQLETDMAIVSTLEELAKALDEYDGSSSEVTVELGWDNWLEDYSMEGRLIGAELSTFEQDDLPDDVLRRGLIGSLVETATGTFRGVGSGHSHSEAAKPREGFNDFKNVDGKMGQPDRWIKDKPPAYHDDESDPIDTDHLIRLGAGTVLKYLNREILPKQNPALALPNMGSWDGQTLAGAINTSTHGTGIGLGTLADLVRSVEIAIAPEARTASGQPHVRFLRVEPTDGITDPVAFAKDAHRHDAELIQDDDLFHSVVVGYGSMGLAYAYTLECREAYWLRERTEVRRWNDIDLPGEARGSRHFNVNVLLASEMDNPRCQVKTRHIVSSNGRKPTERTDIRGSIDEFIETIPQRIVNAATTSGIDNELLRAIRPTGPRWKVGPTEPDPFRNGRSETASYIALRRRSARHPDEPRKAPEKPPDIITTEVNVPVSQVEPAVEAVIDYIQRSSRWFPAPLGVRFTAGSKHKLSPEYGRDNGTAMLELPIPVLEIMREVEVGTGKVYTGKELVAQKAKKLLGQAGQSHLFRLSEAKRELEHVEDILVKRFDGRPHMGKHNTVDTDSNRPYMRPQNMYDEYDAWLAANRYVNRFGTFDAAFTDNKVK